MGKPHRRPPRGGSVFQRKDGRWVAQVPVAPGTRSVRDRRSLYASSEKEAVRLLAEALTALDQGLAVPDPRFTIGEQLREWLEWQRPPRVRPATWVGYEVHVRIHTRPLHGIPLLRLSPADVRRWIVRLQSGPRPLSAGSIEHSLVVLRMAIKQAVDDGRLTRNVATMVRPPESQRFEGTALGIDEIRNLFRSIAGDRLEALYVLAFATGLRQSELLGLRWADIDLAAGELYVKGALRPTPREFREPGDLLRLRREDRGKTDNAKRPFPLAPFAVDQLRRHELEQKASKLANLEKLVFISARGTPIDGRNLTRQFYDRLEEAGVPRIRFHDIRHSTITLLRNMGLTAEDILPIIGHATAAQTWRYTHVEPELRKKVVDAMQEALG